MPRCKASEILRNEAYLDVRRNDEGLGKRSRWAFFSGLLVRPSLPRRHTLKREKPSYPDINEGSHEQE